MLDLSRAWQGVLTKAVPLPDVWKPLAGEQIKFRRGQVCMVAAAFNATPVAQDPGSAPSCRHGAMNYREGVSQRGPWRAHMCSAPKGAADKCDPIFMR